MFKILLDTGADINLIKKSALDNISTFTKSRRLLIQGIGREKTRTLGKVTLQLVINNVPIKTELHVVRDNIVGKFDIFLGSNFIIENKLILDFNQLKVYNDQLSTRLLRFDDSSDCLYDSMKELNSTNSYSNQDVLKNNSFSFPSILQFHSCVEKPQQSDFNLGHLNEQMVSSVTKVLSKFPSVFSELSEKEFPSLQFDSLDVLSNKTIQSKTYRFPQAHEEMVKKEMEKMLNLKIISHSKSPFNSPVWVVPKKDDVNGEKQWRIVIDYRNLNKITIPDKYPLPNITDIIDQLGNAKYFSVLDLVSGFHQIEVNPIHRAKTAFTVLGSHYEFNRLPFGLINSAPAFQRIMTQVLEGLVGKICFVYIDDIVIYGQSLNDHLANLDKVLDRLRVNKLKVKPSKCHFLKESINYLGYVISQNGIKMDPQKTEAIRNFIPPTNEKKLKSFLGLAGFYRKYVPNFSIIAQPLHNLLKKDVVYEWDSKCQQAFEMLINVISHDIVLQFPNFDNHFYLTTDASNFGIGAVLSQKDEKGYDRPLAFISRSLNAAEKNYSTTEKECLAIVWATNHFRNYLFGRKFTILSDHRPLVWLDSVIDPGARLLRWRLKLNNYDYEIRYMPGKLNYVADELSRNNYCSEVVGCPFKEEKVIPSVCHISSTEVEEDDSGVGDNNDDGLEDEEVVETLDFYPKEQRIKLSDPVLIDQLIKEQHTGPIGGHRGIIATEKAINIYYDIPSLRSKVTAIISKCEICQRTKYDRHNRKLPLSLTVTASQPNEKIAFDVIGPFKYPQNQKLYGLTIQDEFSKYILFCGIKDCTAETIAKALVENWILYFGIPKILLSDNGSNLCGEIMTSISSYFNIKRIFTSVAHPQSNGSVERAHARLAEFVRATDSELEADISWKSKLQIASYCYNTTVHSSTGYSPYYLMFGRHPRLITAVSETNDILQDSYLDNFHKNLKQVWESAKKNLNDKKLAAIERDRVETHRRKVELFNVGDLVLIKTATFKGKVNRTEPIWLGPYKIVEVRDTNIVIKKRNRVSVINKSNCKLFIADSQS